MHFIHINKEEVQSHKIIFCGNRRATRIKQTCTVCGKIKYTPITIPMTIHLLESGDEHWMIKGKRLDEIRDDHYKLKSMLYPSIH